MPLRDDYLPNRERKEVKIISRNTKSEERNIETNRLEGVGRVGWGREESEHKSYRTIKWLEETALKAAASSMKSAKGMGWWRRASKILLLLISYLSLHFKYSAHISGWKVIPIMLIYGYLKHYPILEVLSSVLLACGYILWIKKKPTKHKGAWKTECWIEDEFMS